MDFTSTLYNWLVAESPKFIELRKSDEKWVARLWNVSEERVNNAQVNFTTTPFNARSSRFQGAPPYAVNLIELPKSD